MNQIHRRQSWNNFRNLATTLEPPWIICGDFNEVLTQSEFQGSNQRASWQMDLFRNTLQHLNMFDLGYEGSPFTWSCLLTSPHTQRAMLDRAVCNSIWYDLFPWTRAWWVKCKEFENVIKQSWDKSLSDITTKIENCSWGLLNWSKHNQTDLAKRIKAIKKRISFLKNGVITEEAKIELFQLQLQLELSLDQLDIKWKQRSKQHWYKEGNRNTPFFHAFASKRKSNNHISKLKDPSGILRDSPTELEHIITNHFGSIFTSSHPSDLNITQAVARLPSRVTPPMNRMLSENFT
ncbi:hypothetical protein DH2020_007501 [Rehmannia glutinosa]|uniref:Endonuclease/exonuclease/phosphatase domain-containing protein n=1 Tax=Rehmannia glutinosa TaxID=99300 RepID=A0ABR0TYK7_REHGL